MSGKTPKVRRTMNPVQVGEVAIASFFGQFFPLAIVRFWRRADTPLNLLTCQISLFSEPAAGNLACIIHCSG
jgi:hypothetical protein